MAALPEYKRLLREDFAEIEEDWIEKLIYPINQFNEQVTSALNQSLTLTDNVQGAFRSAIFTTASNYNTGTFTPIKLSWGFRTSPNAVLLGRVYLPDSPTTVITAATSVDWNVTSQGLINIRYIAGLANSTKYSVTFVLL